MKLLWKETITPTGEVRRAIDEDNNNLIVAKIYYPINREKAQRDGTLYRANVYDIRNHTWEYQTQFEKVQDAVDYCTARLGMISSDKQEPDDDAKQFVNESGNTPSGPSIDGILKIKSALRKARLDEAEFGTEWAELTNRLVLAKSRKNKVPFNVIDLTVAIRQIRKKWNIARRAVDDLEQKLIEAYEEEARELPNDTDHR